MYGKKSMGNVTHHHGAGEVGWGHPGEVHPVSGVHCVFITLMQQLRQLLLPKKSSKLSVYRRDLAVGSLDLVKQGMEVEVGHMTKNMVMQNGIKNER